MREINFSIISGLQIVSADTAHVFYDNGADFACLNVGDHGLPRRSIEISAGPAVVCIIDTMAESMRVCIITKNLFLHLDGNAVPGNLVVAGETLI